MTHNRILLFSSSREGNSGFLEKSIPFMHSFLGSQPLKITFIPFAAVGKNGDEYVSLLENAFSGLPYNIKLVNGNNPKAMVEEAEVIMIGGGNTFKLLHDIYQYKLLDLIRDKVNSGTAYIGWSAGANITGPGIGTTNDMPVIEPQSFNALGLFPFQINPHYHNKPIENFNGETRDQRLIEFTKLNPGLPIVCLPEGTGLKSEGGKLDLLGDVSATLFYFEDGSEDAHKKEIVAGSDLSHLL